MKSFASILCWENDFLTLSFSLRNNNTHTRLPTRWWGTEKVTVKADVWPGFSFINRPTAAFWQRLSKETIYKFNDSGDFAFAKSAERQQSTATAQCSPFSLIHLKWVPCGHVRCEKSLLGVKIYQLIKWLQPVAAVSLFCSGSILKVDFLHVW